MAKPVAIGLKNLYIGDIAGDGGLGEDLEAVAYSVIDTPVFNIPEGEKTDFPIEESDTPYYSKTTPGVPVFTLSIYGLSAAVLAKHFGGVAVVGATTADPDTWEAPAQIPTFERSIVAEHSQGGYLWIVRAAITATIDWNFQKNNLPQINLSCTVLEPTKANQAAYGFNTAAYVP
jgi:hypothetical protein